MTRAVRFVPVVVVAALIAIGLTQVHFHKAPKATGLTLAAEQAQLTNSPPRLAALHAQGSQLLPTSVSGFKAKLAALRGTPVVINRWASWCGPCVYEFPVLQKTATQFGKRVAFLGIDAVDVDKDAQRFLNHEPVPYPSFIDGDNKVAYSLGFPTETPYTMFIDAAGHQVHLHGGPYTSAAQMAADIKQYLHTRA